MSNLELLDTTHTTLSSTQKSTHSYCLAIVDCAHAGAATAPSQGLVNSCTGEPYQTNRCSGDISCSLLGHCHECELHQLNSRTERGAFALLHQLNSRTERGAFALLHQLNSRTERGAFALLHQLNSRTERGAFALLLARIMWKRIFIQLLFKTARELD